jgi:undecaprenyl-diphosphatase
VDSADPVDTRAIVLGLVISAVTGFVCIHYLLKWLTRFGMLPFVLYRLALGALLLIVLLSGRS